MSLTLKVEKFARQQEVAFSDQTYGMLVKGLSGDPARAAAVVEEALARGIESTPDFVLAVLPFCSQTSNVAMADKLFASLGYKRLNVLASFVRFYADQEEYEKACDIYEKDLAGSADEPQRSSFLDARLERCLMNA